MFLMRQVRTCIAVVGLSGVYWGIVTPLAWLLKVMGRKPLAMFPDPAVSTYWLPTGIDSTAKDLYRQGSGFDVGERWGGGWFRLIRMDRTMESAVFPRAKWLVLLALLPSLPFASYREDAQVYADLYVLF